MTQKVKATSAPGAWIANSKDRGRKSIKNGITYLQDNEEFKIELYNPLQRCVLADIKLNGNKISKSGLVLNPGQRFYLDCFIDDNKKFVFSTYEVEDTDESNNAIAKNGLLEVDFYEESVITHNDWMHINRGCYYNHGNINNTTFTTLAGGRINNYNMTSGTNLNSEGLFNQTTGIIDMNLNTVESYFSNLSAKSVETGRVTKGDISNQKFEFTDMQFNTYKITSVIVKLLPESRKPVETKEIKISSYDPIDILFKLGELNKLGVITDTEFKQKKAELLSKI